MFFGERVLLVPELEDVLRGEDTEEDVMQEVVQGHPPRLPTQALLQRRFSSLRQAGLRKGQCYVEEINSVALLGAYMILGTQSARLFQLFGYYSAQKSFITFWIVQDVLHFPDITQLPYQHRGPLSYYNARQWRYTYWILKQPSLITPGDFRSMVWSYCRGLVGSDHYAN